MLRKPNSGSARLSWARENSKHRRTATRQQGFCCSVLKQNPFDFSQTEVPLEDHFFKIISKGAALQAPSKSTEPMKSRVFLRICQLRGVEMFGVQPAIGIRRGDVYGFGRNHQEMQPRNVRDG